MIDGHDFLISYIKREQQGPDGMVRRYVVVLKVNLEYLERKFFPEVFSKLQGRVEFAVVNDRNQVVFGQQPRAAAEFLYSAYFPTTLYLWRLEMAPPEAARLSAEARARRVSETTLVILMVATILVGLSFLIYAIIKEQRANQLKSDFISNVSHELKTPLSLIRMFGELIALGKLKSPEKGKEYAEIITREAERLSRLIDNVLDFARIERGKAAYDFQPGDLGEVVARSVDVYRHREGVKLTVTIDEEIPLTLIDENAMTLVLLNLLDNAVKYGGDRPEIGVTLRCQAQEEALRLEVSDRGPGIPRDEQRRIFDRFYRARAARTRNTRGSGIGLSLVKHIAESHGGGSRWTARSGGGDLHGHHPAASGPRSGAGRGGRMTHVQATPPLRRRILIIEDEPDIVRGLTDAVEFEGFEVLSTGEGKSGVRLARDPGADLIILDLMLPDINGYQVCEEIRAFNPVVPIIILTARGQESDKIRGLDAGADDYVTKPFSVGELLARIKAVFRRLHRSAAAAGRGAAHRRERGEREETHDHAIAQDAAAVVLRGRAAQAPHGEGRAAGVTRRDPRQDLGHRGLPLQPHGGQLHRQAAEEGRGGSQESAPHPDRLRSRLQARPLM